MSDVRPSSPRFLRPIALVLAFACGAGLPSPAAAADKPAGAKPAPETADSLYNQGNDAYDRGDYALAVELFGGAFKLRQSYDIARNLGLAELKLRRYKDAIVHFEYSLSIYPSNRADTKKQVVEWLAQARAEVGSVRLFVDPEPAACTLRGAPVTPAEREADLVVDPGDVSIECKLEGHRTERRTVKIDRGKREEVTITLAPTGAPAPTGTASVPTANGPPPGGDARMIVTWAGAATAAAGLGLGIAMGVASLVKAGEADGLLADLRASSGRQSPCAAPAGASCTDLLALRKEQDVFGNLAFWMLLAGGVAGGGTATYFFLTRPPETPPPAPGPAARRSSAAPLRPTVRSFVPVAAPGGAALTLSGSF